MAKLTLEQERLHEQACRLVDSDRPLDEDEKEFVLDHYLASSTARSASDRAHFTPAGLAREMAHLEVFGERVVDLCAGIGRLAFHCRDSWGRYPHGSRPLVCIERNPEYVRVGKRVVPEAQWICADVMDIPTMLDELGTFDYAVSNPPYGAVPRSADAPGGYRGRRFEYHVIALASMIARRGTFLIPQTAAPFSYSGLPGLQRDTGDDEYRKFVAATGIELKPEPSVGIDTAFYKDDWLDVNVVVEVVRADFAERASAARLPVADHHGQLALLTR
ncbi:class I SAM-dependent methyltransferase [Lentzea atacamensis]|uniref:methyltransferase n=1 Tax=Lentzea atacamensis TaxID=531938 RepID=UPI0011BE97D6|nr:methyltransferase [Lentzea atacamensis]